MNFSLSIATPSDAAAVAEIGKETFYETWRSVNTEEDMQLYMQEAFDRLKIKSDIEKQEVNLFLLALDQTGIIGYAKLRRDRTYDEFKGQKVIEIERIYVKSEYHGKKVGKLLMDGCIDVAKKEQNSWLWLGVNDQNVKAIRFYTKYGFEVFGTKQFRLGNAVDDDLLMKLKL